jgi:hypothetical protein
MTNLKRKRAELNFRMPIHRAQEFFGLGSLVFQGRFPHDSLFSLWISVWVFGVCGREFLFWIWVGFVFCVFGDFVLALTH